MDKTIELICGAFAKEFNEIAKRGMLTRLTDTTIEKAQLGYLESLVFFLINKSGLPVNIQKKILEDVKLKIEGAKNK